LTDRGFRTTRTPDAPSAARVAVGAVLALGGIGLMVAAQLDLGPAWRVGIEAEARPGLVTTGWYAVGLRRGPWRRVPAGGIGSGPSAPDPRIRRGGGRSRAGAPGLLASGMRKVACEQCPTFAGCIVRDLRGPALDDFRACSVSGIYRCRQVLFHEGAPAGALYLLCLGSVKLYQSDGLGREHILAVAAPGEVLSELPLAADDTYSVSAEALTDCQVSWIARDRLVAFLHRHPEVGVQLVGALSRALGAARRKAREFALMRAQGRLAELLVQLVRASGEVPRNGRARVALAYSRRELAEMIGVSTETAIRLLARLKQKRLIEVGRHDLVVTDLSRLARLANRRG